MRSLFSLIFLTAALLLWLTACQNAFDSRVIDQAVGAPTSG